MNGRASLGPIDEFTKGPKDRHQKSPNNARRRMGLKGIATTLPLSEHLVAAPALSMLTHNNHEASIGPGGFRASELTRSQP